jgi:basic amino acid/polyamine antiporter, APA family
MSNESAQEPLAVPSPSSPTIGVTTGTLLIVANMIGVGVFTTTGYMIGALQSPPAVLIAWLVGGVAAFCGALAYAELGAAVPRNGGEYQLLSRIFHPMVGFVAGWVSLIVGFAAPLAAFAMKFGEYLTALGFPLPPVASGLILIIVLAILHSLDVGTGSRTHNVFTLGKVALIAAFIAAGLAWGDLSRLTAAAEQSPLQAVLSPMFGVQLVYVSFAYSGWNTAAYLAGEFRRPAQEIPWAVLAGTTVVAVLYLGLNVVFLASAPAGELAGKDEVGHVAAISLFGNRAGNFMSFLIVVGLVSTASANTMAGPRVYEAMGFDYPILKILTTRRAGGGPVFAIALQTALAAAMLMTASFKTLVEYIGVTLSLVAATTVLGVIVLRLREPVLARPYRTWGYPVTPLVFLALEAWMVYYMVRKEPLTAAVSAGTIVVGLILYVIVRPRNRS